MFKLIGTDLDGTLLNDNKKVSEENTKYLQLAKESNMIIVAVTGRALESVKSVVNINLFDYLILNNGVNIFDVKQNKLIYNDFIDKNIVKKITEFSDHYSKQFNYCTYKSYEVYKNFTDKGIAHVKEVKNVDEISTFVSKINIRLNDVKQVEFLHDRIKNNFPELNSFIMQDSGNDDKWIIVTPNNINKKEALENLGNYLGISPDEMVFFGDALNDLEAIEMVGMGVAMGNALDEVIIRAKAITLSNNDNGVAHFIKQNILDVKTHSYK